MSGIAGIVRFDEGDISEESVTRLQEALAHRGPDGSAMWRDHGVVLGQWLFHTTPESSMDELPMVGAGGRWILVADARIDNRDQLLPELFPGRDAATVGDGAVILEAWLRWGDEAPGRLVGDYAFAIYDTKERRVYCARDSAGARPFYYARGPWGFCFASEVKGILATGLVPARLNELKFGLNMVGYHEETTETMFQGVMRLSPARMLACSAERQDEKVFWKLDSDRELKLKSDAEYEEGFREVLGRAVRDRIRSNGPPGAELSGGLDSSSIVCLAQQHFSQTGNGGTLHTYSSVFPLFNYIQPKLDEIKYIDAVLGLGHVAPHRIEADLGVPVFPELTGLDEFATLPNIFLLWRHYQEAQQDGVRVILSGHDGDSIVSYGYERLSEMFDRGQWLAMHREMRAVCERNGFPMRWLWWNYCVKYKFPDSWMRRRRRRQHKPYYHFRIRRGILTREFRERIGLDSYLEEAHLKVARECRTIRAAMARNMVAGTLLSATESNDHLGTLRNVELRYPFLDRRVMEYCLALPLDQRLRNGRVRDIMHRSMAGVLPQSILDRVHKANFTMLFNVNLLRSGRETIERALYGTDEPIAAFANIKGLRGDYETCLKQPLEAAIPAMFVYTATVANEWLRKRGFGK